jgi:hypothetical protein
VRAPLDVPVLFPPLTLLRVRKRTAAVPEEASSESDAHADAANKDAARIVTEQRARLQVTTHEQDGVCYERVAVVPTFTG